MRGRRHRTRALLTLVAGASGALLITIGATVTRADSLTLRDGSVVDGVVRQIDGGYEVTTADGSKRFIAIEQVKSIKLSNEGKITEGNARERLQSLQRSVENERDLNRIIERFEQFAAMTANTEAGRLAQTELDTWRARRDGKMVKVGRNWVTPAERDQRLLEAAKRVDEICAMIAAGQIDPATAALRAALEDEPDNVSYLYLTGILQVRRGQFNEAKRSFDLVVQQVPDHAPTLYNEAVLAVQFKRWQQAIAALDQALTAAPGAQEILDGIVEFTQLVPDVAKRSPTYDRLMQRFAPQEAALTQAMATHGYFRFGSRWVDQAAFDKAKADQAAFEKTKADMQADYDATQERARKVDDDMSRIARLIDQIERDSILIDRDGNVINRGYPPAYWDYQRDLDRLKQQRNTEQSHLDDLKKKAVDVEANAPKSPFAGRLNPVNENGVPIVLPAPGPTTQSIREQALRDAEIRITSTRPSTQPAVEAP